MRAYKTYKYSPFIKKYHNNQPEIISFYVENVPVVTNIIYRIRRQVSNYAYRLSIAQIAKFRRFFTLLRMTKTNKARQLHQALIYLKTKEQITTKPLSCPPVFYTFYHQVLH